MYPINPYIAIELSRQIERDNAWAAEQWRIAQEARTAARRPDAEPARPTTTPAPLRWWQTLSLATAWEWIRWPSL